MNTRTDYMRAILADDGAKTLAEALRCAEQVLTEIVDGSAESDRYGYGAAHVALNDDWRERARYALAQVRAAR